MIDSKMIKMREESIDHLPSSSVTAQRARLAGW